MKTFDMLNVVSMIPEKVYEGGSFDIEFVMPDNSSVEISGFIDVIGRMIHDVHRLNDPYFDGCYDVTIHDSKAYEPDGTRMYVINEKVFENKLNEYLNRD